MAEDIPRVVSTAGEDSHDDEHSQKSKQRKGKSIDYLISKVKSKTGKKKSNSSLLPSPVKKSHKVANTDPAASKKPKKKKPKAKVKKEKPKKSSKSSDEEDDDILGEDEDEYDLPDDDLSDESSGEMSIPFVIEVLADGGEDVDQARDVEKESKKHESMHNSHNALRVLERADSGKSLKEKKLNRRISTNAPKRTRSMNAQQALNRVNSSKPLSAIQREVKTRDRTRGVGRKRPSAANPHRHSSLKSKGNTSGHGRPQRTKSLDAAKAFAASSDDDDDGELKALYGEAQRKADRERRRRNKDSVDDNGSSRRTQRSIDEDFVSGGTSSSRRTQRSIDDDMDGGSKRGSHRTFGGRSIDQDLSSRRTQRSIDIEEVSDDELKSNEMGLTDAESKKRALERRARRESQRNTVHQAAEVLQRADSGKSLKEIANDSRRRRSNSVSSHHGSSAHKRNNSTGPSRNRRISVATPEGAGAAAAAADSMRMKEIEAQIKAEEQALKEGL